MNNENDLYMISNDEDKNPVVQIPKWLQDHPLLVGAFVVLFMYSGVILFLLILFFGFMSVKDVTDDYIMNSMLGMFFPNMYFIIFLFVCWVILIWVSFHAAWSNIHNPYGLVSFVSWCIDSHRAIVEDSFEDYAKRRQREIIDNDNSMRGCFMYPTYVLLASVFSFNLLEFIIFVFYLINGITAGEYQTNIVVVEEKRYYERKDSIGKDIIITYEGHRLSIKLPTELIKEVHKGDSVAITMRRGGLGEYIFDDCKKVNEIKSSDNKELELSDNSIVVYLKKCLPEVLNTTKGRVGFTFLVSKDGTVSKVEKTKGLHRRVDKALMDALSDMNVWNNSYVVMDEDVVRYNLDVYYHEGKPVTLVYSILCKSQPIVHFTANFDDMKCWHVIPQKITKETESATSHSSNPVDLGNKRIARYFKKRLPKVANTINGSVGIAFNVSKDGRISRIGKMRSLHESIDTRLVEVLMDMKVWDNPEVIKEGGVGLYNMYISYQDGKPSTMMYYIHVKNKDSMRYLVNFDDIK